MKFLTPIVFVLTLAVIPASHSAMGNIKPSPGRRGLGEVQQKPSPPRRGQGEVPNTDTPMLSLSGTAQGTTYHIRYFDDQNRNLKKEVDSILVDFDKCLSLYRADSELSRFNRADHHRFESRYFYPVLKKSREVYDATQGAFDPTVLPLVEAYGFGPKKTAPNPLVNIDSLLQFVGLDLLSFDSLSVRKKNNQVRLDFNGIAQGQSVDVIARFLEVSGITRFMVEIGGEIVCKGLKNGGKVWVTGIDNPLKPGTLCATINLTNRAMTTAGNYRSQFEKDGQVYNHLINPRNGSMEQTSVLSVTVFAKDAMTADAYDTAFFVMGLEQIKAFLAKQKDIDVYVIYNDGGRLQTYTSEGIRPFLKELKR